MPSNDTENIYATQYGGEGEPIPATKISYNNTESHLSATNVQEAIDELKGDIPTDAGDVEYDNTASGLEATSVQNAIDEVVDILNDKYLLTGIQTFSATGDGTKTYAAMLAELGTAFTTFLSTLADDECAEILSLNGAYNALPLMPKQFYSNTVNFSDIDFIGVNFADNFASEIVTAIRMFATAADCHFIGSVLNSVSQDFAHDYTNATFGNASVLTIRIAKYKKV